MFSSNIIGANVKHFTYGLIAVLIGMGILDGAWLSFAVSRLYRPGIGHLMSERPNAWAALAFYLLYAAGVSYLVVQPALAARLPGEAFLRGGVLGLIAYGTYDLTSLAVLRGWPLSVTVIDMVWGMILTGVSAGIATLVVLRLV
ncbi:MAG: hypothetical protein B7Z80_11195 [Rhodospirillales bacterium 20-64-7]|nr:MAG: hypothetical protein B7Z80_11195 [Rhodospirillales bacterium 20-64-7]